MKTNTSYPTKCPRKSVYTLASGYSLWIGSRKMQVSCNDLMQANGVPASRQLRGSQKLKVRSEQIDTL